MIDWFYSDPRIVDFVTGVTRAYQKKSEPTKTILDTSNRSRIVTDVVGDDFMHSERPLSAKQVHPCLAAPPHLPWMVEQRDMSSASKSSENYNVLEKS